MTLAQARNLLEKERARLSKSLGLRVTPTAMATGGDEADEVSESTDRVLLFATREQRMALLRAVDEALDRIAEGRFGLCLTCEETIPAPRLRANPAAARCVPCETAREEQARRLPDSFRLGDPEAAPHRRKRPPEEDYQC